MHTVMVMATSVKDAVVCLSIHNMNFHGNNLFILVEVIDLSACGSLGDLLYTVQLFCSATIGLLILSFYVMLNV